MCPTRTHSVEQREELQKGGANRQLQEASELLHCDAASSAGAGDSGEALQLLPHVVPLEAGGGDQRDLDGRTAARRRHRMVLLELAADLGELDQAGLHGQRQLAGRDHQTTVLVGVVGHWDPQSPVGGQDHDETSVPDMMSPNDATVYFEY